MKATIPVRALIIFSDVARSHPGMLEKISSSMAGVEVGLEPFEETRAIVRQLASLVSGGGELVDKLVTAVNAALFAFAYTQRDTILTLDSAEAFLRAESPVECDEVLSFLRFVSNAENLYTSCKAAVLADEVCNLVEDSRVIVDVRPVFSRHNPSDVIASVFVRTLRISYRDTGDSRPKTVSFSLGLDDIEELRAALEKAEVKVKLLQEKLGRDAFGVILEHKNV